MALTLTHKQIQKDGFYNQIRCLATRRFKSVLVLVNPFHKVELVPTSSVIGWFEINWKFTIESDRQLRKDEMKTKFYKGDRDTMNLAVTLRMLR